jgi:2-acylglycerol O-acyltransferase 2
MGAFFGISLNLEFDAAAPRPRPDKQYICTASPHSCFPLSLVGLGMWRFRPGLGRFTDERFAPWRAMFAGASVLFWVPLLRELLLLAGVRDATRRNILRLLADGRTVAVNPGGIWEMVHSRWGEETIYVQKRLGFVRIAMESGTPLLAAYAFGENQIFRGSGFMLGPRLWVVRKLRVGIPLMTGRCAHRLWAHGESLRELAALSCCALKRS